jgi:hypothetical protein
MTHMLEMTTEQVKACAYAGGGSVKTYEQFLN